MRFATAQLAFDSLQVIWTDSMAKGRIKFPLDYYGCHLCLGFHLTSSMTPAKAKRVPKKKKFKKFKN